MSFSYDYKRDLKKTIQNKVKKNVWINIDGQSYGFSGKRNDLDYESYIKNSFSDSYDSPNSYESSKSEEYSSKVTIDNIANTINIEINNSSKYGYFSNKKYPKKSYNNYDDLYDKVYSKKNDTKRQKDLSFSFQRIFLNIIGKVFPSAQVRFSNINLANQYLENHLYDEYINFVSNGYSPTSSQISKTDILFIENKAFREKTFNKLQYPLSKNNISKIFSFDFLMDYIYGNNTYSFPEAIHRTLQNPQNSTIAWNQFNTIFESTIKWVPHEIKGGSTSLVHRQDKYLLCLAKHFINHWEYNQVSNHVLPIIKKNGNLPLLTSYIDEFVLNKLKSTIETLAPVPEQYKTLLSSIENNIAKIETHENLDIEVKFNLENIKSKVIPQILNNYAKITPNKKNLTNAAGKNAEDLVFDALTKIQDYLISQLSIIDEQHLADLSAQHKYIDSITKVDANASTKLKLK